MAPSSGDVVIQKIAEVRAQADAARTRAAQALARREQLEVQQKQAQSRLDELTGIEGCTAEDAQRLAVEAAERAQKLLGQARDQLQASKG